MTAIYTATRSGAGFDLLSPNPATIDFDEIALTLAYINRHNGAFEKPISVAQHTLIAVDCAPFSLKPWVALHAAPEAYIGDLTRPTVSALNFIAEEIAPTAKFLVYEALGQLRHRLNAAIHEAAGLPLPTMDQVGAVETLEEVALATERRDFLARPRFAWRSGRDMGPSSRRYRFMPPHDVGAQLAQMFRTLLPSLSDRSPR